LFVTKQLLLLTAGVVAMYVSW